MLKNLIHARMTGALVAAVGAASMVCGVGCQGPVNAPAPPTDETPAPPTDETPAPPTDETVSFSADIQPIFTDRCTDCHVVGGLADIAGIPLKLVADESFALLVDQPSSQQPELTLVVPGDAAASLLFLKVSSDSPPVGATMPLAGARLSSADVGLIRDWINQGALDN